MPTQPSSKTALAQDDSPSNQRTIAAVVERSRRGSGAVLNWVPVILWAAVIYTLSTSFFSAAETSTIIEPILRFLFPHAGPAAIDVMHEAIRKTAHFLVYGVLFWLLIRGPLKRRAVFALLLCALYAGFDELHQVYVPSRTASAMDVMLDFSGALFSCFYCYLLANRPGKDRLKAAPAD